ncbi:Hypothetical_protein [Hexamita inflata]|uniref:Hypothetical_protein n=1 Tax=Hexamita inflata TaxID=28002 RepID=A0AA86Q1F2_9EUKA|nr:Hypothetical protein HINF_LOCUS27687 [Hexamita inflata]CAI9950265.1 Hypothetical protein HINF_LOCUS37910 [Hexamita inflata]
MHLTFWQEYLVTSIRVSYISLDTNQNLTNFCLTFRFTQYILCYLHSNYYQDTTVHPESLAALREVGIEEPLLYQREQTDNIFRGKTRKAPDQPTELNVQKIDQKEEFSSIPVNETTNSNAGTQDSSQDINSTILSHQEYRQHLDEPRSYQYSKTSCYKQFQLQQHQSSCITKIPKYQLKRSSKEISNSINLTQASSLNSNQKKTLEFLRDQDIKLNVNLNRYY